MSEEAKTVYPPPSDEPLTYRTRILNDFKKLRLDFRINDLDDSPWVNMDGRWEMLSKPLRAEIRQRLRKEGYSRQNTGKVAVTTAEDEYLALAHQQRYNPIKEYFEKLRLTSYHPRQNEQGFYEPYFIPEITSYLTNPDGYAARWLLRWTVGCIARLFEQARNPMLVLAGGQNMGKSSFVRWYCPEPLLDYFREGAIRPEIKDERIRLADTFIQEVPELGNSTRKSDMEAVKDYLTRKFIVERLPYGDLPVKKPAICNFLGTVNSDGAGFLVDPTGSSRFLVCEITAIDFGYSDYNNENVWREALWFYDHQHRAWELTPKEKEAQQEINARYQTVNALEDVLENKLLITHDPKDWMTTYDIREWLKPFYRTSSDQRFNIELAKVLTAKGLVRDRGAYRKGEPHRWGWYGITKPKTIQLKGLNEPKE